MGDKLIYEALKKYSSDIYPFHMPGHKFGRHIEMNDLLKIDVTEVAGTDNLHHPESIIKDAHKRAANLFGADDTYFLVNGSTGGILSAISATCSKGDKILIARNCHRAVYNAVMINDLIPIYCYPDIDSKTGIIGGINPDRVEQILKKNNDIRMVVITSPTYEGIVSDIERIAKISHDYDTILCVDEAHGSHFKFHENFPKTALEMGADIVIQSTHKTLPAFTQSAMLHVKSSKVNRYNLRQQLAIYQTSSPSYILLSGLDYCCHLLENKGNTLFSAYMENLLYTREKLVKDLNHLRLLDTDIISKNAIVDIDISKIVIFCGNTNINGVLLDYRLREDYKLQVELSSPYHVVALTSVSDTKEALEKLIRSLYHIDSCLQSKINKAYFPMVSAEVRYTPSQAMKKEKKIIPIEASVGKIAGEFVIPFPPGIPLIVPGEMITKDVLDIIRYYLEYNMTLLGMSDIKGRSIQILDHDNKNMVYSEVF